MIRLAAFASCSVTTTHRHAMRGARDDESRLLAQPHRATLHVTIELQMHDEHELEPTRLRDRIELWLLDNYAVNAEDATAATVALCLLDQLRVWYPGRGARVSVDEHGEAGSWAETPWIARAGRHPDPRVPE